ncbi:hypothetical protein [Actinophytocola sp.]|uniref:RCC1 domain-containing protein n=1 Tax=Actinophytocola sp. TaxID=1872138 RepID=UPI002ED660BF
MTSAHSTPGSATAVADPGAFTAVSPVRVMDTRSGFGATGPVGPAGTVTLDLSTRVPASTTAVVLNVTGTAPTTDTFVTVFPSGVSRPTTSNLNLVAGETRPNLVTVAIGADRKVVLYNHNGSVHLIADLSGYYATDQAAATGRFTAYYAVRVMDTRKGFGFRPPGPVGPDGVETIDLSNQVPDSATAVTLNVTGTEATTGTFVTAWPAGTPRPTTSNLNLTAGATVPNQVVVALGADRKISLYNKNGNAHLVVDISGFYTPDYGALFTPVVPKRVLDTRNGGGAVGPGDSIYVDLATSVPANTAGVVMNLTGTQGTAGTHITGWAPSEPRPQTSNLNLAPGQTAANLTTTGIGDHALVALNNYAGSVHLIADLAGYFSLPPTQCTADCVYAWGNNEYGALGTGTYQAFTATPGHVYGLSDVVATSANGDTGYALRADGTVWAWGANWTGELGNGWTGSKSVVPVPVVGLDNVVAIDGTVALTSSGTVWAWGRVPHYGSWDVPGYVPLTDVTAIAAGNGVAYALKSDGTVWSWGSNGFGSLGNGAAPDFHTNQPVQVSGLTGVRKIAAGFYGALALKDDGTVWSWGDNRQGQLGQGTVGGDGCYNLPPTAPNCFANVPGQVLNLTGVTAIGADSAHSFAVLADGTAWGWGNPYLGGLGNGQECYCPTGTPVRVTGLTGAREIDGNEHGGYALDADGRIWAWGNNIRAALGPVDTPEVPNSNVPLRLREPIGVTAIAGGLGGGYALVP